MEGAPQSTKSIAPPAYIPGVNPGTNGGGTYTSAAQEPSIDDYESVFGPAARDIKRDPERNRRRQRLHLPDVLQGPNPWLTDRVDGLITDTSNSAFTSVILPYKHIDNVDGKIKWNVWSFDEGLASRVPYESSARVLTQTKRSFAGYTVRQGLAILMEANFMMSPQGRDNFKNQLTQVVGSIQNTNDLDVHVALIQAPSYQQQQNEKFFSSGKTQQQLLREYVDLFGFLQKNPNGLDIAIEEAKDILRSWGAKEPTFLLTNSKLTMQLTMTPERTQYFTQGYDGVKRLQDGPELASYRGLKVIHSKAFSIETGARPRDLLNRRVRVAEYYRIPWHHDNPNRTFEFYDESRDSWFSMTWSDLVSAARLPGDDIEMHGQRAEYARYCKLGTAKRTFYDGTTLVEKGNDEDASYGNDENSGTNPHDDKRIFVPQSADHAFSLLRGLVFGANCTNGLSFNDVSNKTFNALNGWDVAKMPATARWLAYFLTRTMTDQMLTSFRAKLPDAASLPMHKQIAMVCTGTECALTSAIGAGVLDLLYAALHSTRTNERLQFRSILSDITTQEYDCIFHAMLSGDTDSFLTRVTAAASHVNGSEKYTITTNFTKLAAKFPKPNTEDGAENLFSIFLYAMMLRVHGKNILHDDDADARKVKVVNMKISTGTSVVDGSPTEYTIDNLQTTEKMFFVGNRPLKDIHDPMTARREIVIVRPNIEHNMLGVIMGRGGLDDLGGTLWGQTQLECYSDSMHGLWGMSYKYNERAIVWNEKNLVRLWDVCYGSYSGGKDSRLVSWDGDGPRVWKEATNRTNDPYNGPSLAVMSFEVVDGDVDWVRNWPSPISYHSSGGNKLPCDPDNLIKLDDSEMFTMWGQTYRNRYAQYQRLMPNFTELHLCDKVAGESAQENLCSTQSALAFQGSMRTLNQGGQVISEVNGCGHHGPDYVGVASRRNGKGMNMMNRPGVPIFGAV